MNDGDVFILDIGNVVYVWIGKASSQSEQIKVISFCYFILISSMSRN